MHPINEYIVSKEDEAKANFSEVFIIKKGLYSHADAAQYPSNSSRAG